MASRTTAGELGKPLAGWRLRLYTIIFEADTRGGRLFDQGLVLLILCSIAAVMAGSVQAIAATHGRTFAMLEWFFTIAFTLEYLARLALCPQFLWCDRPAGPAADLPGAAGA
jgi:voltage-gated potassium channel